MSLYHFHRVLIAAAILFDLYFSLYCYRRYSETGELQQLYMLIGSSLITVALVIYLVLFNKKMQMLSRLSRETPVAGDA